MQEEGKPCTRNGTNTETSHSSSDIGADSYQGATNAKSGMKVYPLNLPESGTATMTER